MSCGTAHAEFIKVGEPLSGFALLQQGTVRYLRFVETADSNIPLNMSSREVRFEGKQVRIRQRWDVPGKQPLTILVDSTFESGTLRPLTHTRVTERDGERKLESFSFSAERVSGVSDLAGNTQAAFSMPSPEQTFNFETDLELLQTLPFAPGYVAEINFYHPGGTTPPARYTYKVVGEDTIAGPLGPIECWVVTSDYNKKDELSTYWFAKRGQLLIRQVKPLPDGRKMVQTLVG
jgi:hypothetical protein